MKQESLFKFYHADLTTAVKIPFFKGGLQAGFPSPAADYFVGAIDLNVELIENPSSTFYGIVDGDSMENAHIFDGDLCIIDKSKKPKEGLKILFTLDNEFTIKYFEYDKTEKDVIWLLPANNKYPPIRITSDRNLTVYGVVLYTITPHTKKFRK